jgi:hypothetical protein
LSRFRSDCRRGMDWILDLLTTWTHHSELQLITAPSLISTLSKSQQNPLSLFPACYIFNSRPLTTATNSGDPSPSYTHVVALRRIFHNWNLVNCQPNYSAISSQPPLQSSTQVPTLNLTHHFSQLNYTQPAWGPCYIDSGRTQQKTPPFPLLSVMLCASRFLRGVYTEPLPSNTCSFSRSLHSNGTTPYNILLFHCLPSMLL